LIKLNTSAIKPRPLSKLRVLLLVWEGGCPLHSIIPTNKISLDCRLGCINFINTLVVDYPLLHKYNFLELIEASPNILNDSLRDGSLDIAAISSFEFLSNKQLYKVLFEYKKQEHKEQQKILFQIKKAAMSGLFYEV
jgi:preprotein translocase subunit Sec63